MNILVLHIIGETVLKVVTKLWDVKKAGVLATNGAIKTKILQNNFIKYRIEVINLPLDIQSVVDNVRYSYKIGGVKGENVMNIERRDKAREVSLCLSLAELI